MSDKVCLIRDDGTRECIDIDGGLFKETSRLTMMVVGLIAGFIGIFIVVSIMSFLNGALGFDVVAALILSGIIMLFPVSFILLVILIYILATRIGFGETINIVILILVIVGIGIGAFFLYSWAAGMVSSLWTSMIGSW